MAFGGGGFHMGPSIAASGLGSSFHSDASQVYHQANSGGAGKLPKLQPQSSARVLNTAAAMAAVATATTSTSPRLLSGMQHGEAYRAPSLISSVPSLPSREPTHTVHPCRDYSLPIGVADMGAGPGPPITAHKPLLASVGPHQMGSHSREDRAVLQAQVQAAVATLLQEQPHLLSAPPAPPAPPKLGIEQGCMTGASLLVGQPDPLIPEPVTTELKYPKEAATDAPSFYYPVNAQQVPLASFRAGSTMPLIFENRVHYSGQSSPRPMAAAAPFPPAQEMKGEVEVTSATRKKKRRARKHWASTCEECCC